MGLHQGYRPRLVLIFNGFYNIRMFVAAAGREIPLLILNNNQRRAGNQFLDIGGQCLIPGDRRQFQMKIPGETDPGLMVSLVQALLFFG